MDINITLTKEETEILIKALYNYNYDGLEEHENKLLDQAQCEINYQYINQLNLYAKSTINA